MENDDQRNEEFYIGYLPEAPQKISWFVRKIVIGLGILIILLCTIVVSQQQRFSTSSFEYGIPTTINGRLFKTPFPHVRIDLGRPNESGPMFKSILLVGFGKTGAFRALNAKEQETGTSLHGKSISIAGNLIYGDGKILLQVNDVNDIKLDTTDQRFDKVEIDVQLGPHQVVEGEIVDPKCYFGVMKPGEGKPHRSCAIRCISGGIPPVIHSGNSYYLIVGNDMEPVNENVLHLVGDVISLEGEIAMMDDWNILKVDTDKLKELNAASGQQKSYLAMESGITICK